MERQRHREKQHRSFPPLPPAKPSRAVERFLLYAGGEPKKPPDADSTPAELRSVPASSFPRSSGGVRRRVPLNETSSLVAQEDTDRNFGYMPDEIASPVEGMGPVVKGLWTADEDRLLIRLVEQHGARNWPQIARNLPGRVGKQCRERWHNHLRPNIKKDAWTEHEERLLAEAHEKMGNRWAEIAKLIPGRTDNTIKNHWKTIQRRQNSANNPPLQQILKTADSARGSGHVLHPGPPLQFDLPSPSVNIEEEELIIEQFLQDFPDIDVLPSEDYGLRPLPDELLSQYDDEDIPKLAELVCPNEADGTTFSSVGMTARNSLSEGYVSGSSHWSISDGYTSSSSDSRFSTSSTVIGRASLYKESLVRDARASSSSSTGMYGENRGDVDLLEMMAKFFEIKSRGSRPFP